MKEYQVIMLVQADDEEHAQQVAADRLNAGGDADEVREVDSDGE